MPAAIHVSFPPAFIKKQCLIYICLASCALLAAAFMDRRPSFPIIPTGHAHRSLPAPAAAGLASLPREAQSSVSAALGRDRSDYQARAHGEGFRAENVRHNLAADFTSAGVEVRSGNGLWKLALHSYGYGNTLKPVGAAAPRVDRNRVEYRRGPLTEWYVNGPLGLEQGFTLNVRPGCRGTACRTLAPSHDAIRGGQSPRVGQALPLLSQTGNEPLTVALALSGDVTAAVDPNQTGMTLTSRDGRAVLRYTGLVARDAGGKDLHAWLEVRGAKLLLEVDDTRARYPVVIDPWVQLVAFTGSDWSYPDSVATDGNTVVVGDTCANGCNGAAYVLVRLASGWTQVAELTPLDTRSTPYGFPSGENLGWSVAVAGDTVVVGATLASCYYVCAPGAAYVFVKPASGWTNMTQTAMLTASDGTLDDWFGESVSISGNTVVVGASYVGAAYVFVQPATGWANMTETAKLTSSDGVGIGWSVAISGNTAVGAPGEFGLDGDACYGSSAYVFVEPASGWANMTETAKLTPSDGGCANSASISGNTVVVGDPVANVGGEAYVFVKPASGWTSMPETAKLTASDVASSDLFGLTAAISGNTVAVGALQAGSSGVGGVYVFVQPTSGWTSMNETAELTASGGALGDSYDQAFFESIGGNVVVALGETGAAYIFVDTSVMVSPSQVDFGYVPPGTTSPAQEVTLTNNESTELSFTVGVTGEFAESDSCGGTVAASGGTCKLYITFHPTTLAHQTGMLSIIDTGPCSPQQVSLTGTDIQPLITLSPTSLSFGNQAINTTSSARLVTIENSGTDLLTLTSITPSGDFAAPSNTCSTTLNPGATCTVDVTFTPTALVSFQGTLTITDNNKGVPGSTQSIALTGAGTYPKPYIKSLSPTSATAGGAAQTLTIDGAHFLSTTTVTFHGLAHKPTFVSATQLEIILSASDQALGGTYAVQVTNPAPGGGESNVQDFTVDYPKPYIKSLSPASATAGVAAQTLTINGSRFFSTSTVDFHGVAHKPTLVSSTELKITLSATDQAKAGTYAVQVSNPAPGGGESNVQDFTVNSK
jgi:hypothetical protein